MLWWVRIHSFCPLKIIFSKVVSIQKSLSNRNPTFSGFFDSRSQVEDCWGAKGFDLGPLCSGGLESIPFAPQRSFSQNLWAFEYSDIRGQLYSQYY